MNGPRDRGLAIALVVGLASVASLAQQPLWQLAPAVAEQSLPLKEEAPVRPGARMKRFDSEKKIIDRFDASAGDRDVVVERWENDGESVGPPPGVSDVAWRTIYSPVVMIVRVTAIEGYLAEDGMWIESRMTGTVTQLLKNATPANLELNSPVFFTASGGTITTGSHSIEALPRTARGRDKQFRKNGDYLIFTVKRPGDVLFAHPHASYEIVGKQLRALRESQGGIHKSIADAGADAVIAEALASRALLPPPRRK